MATGLPTDALDLSEQDEVVSAAVPLGRRGAISLCCHAARRAKHFRYFYSAEKLGRHDGGYGAADYVGRRAAPMPAYNFHFLPIIKHCMVTNN